MYNDVHWHNRNKVYSNETLQNRIDQIFDVTVSKAGVNDTFWYKVKQLVFEKTPIYWNLNWNDEIGNELVNSKGKIAKRISSKLYKAESYKLPAELVSEIGNLANQYKSEPFTVTIDLTQDFDWANGMYGKSGSCYWGGHAHSRDLLDSMDCYALRYYETPDYSYDHSGVGRTWILPVKGDDTDGALILINAYGTTLETSANVICEILSTPEVKYHWHKIALMNSADDEPYINDDRGILVYPESLIGWARDYDLNNEFDLDWDWDDDGYFANPITCYDCDTRLTENTMYTSEMSDHVFCQSCYYERFAYCHKCESDCDRESSVEFDGETYCEYCISKVAVKCWNCEDWHSIDDITIDREGDAFCETCATKHLTYCSECDEYTYHDNLNHLAHLSVCDICLESIDPDNLPDPRPVVTENQLPLF